jgi:ankyrin repeat protein
MRSRHLLVVLIVLISCSFARAGIAHAKARAGDVEYFHDAMELDEINEREEGTGQTPLMAASLAGMHLAVEKLLDLGADADIPEKDAVGERKGRAWIDALLRHGADVAYQVEDTGDTLLHAAVMSQDVEVIEAVVEAGGDVLVKNKKGLTPRGLAKSLGLEAATNVLSRTKFARGKEEL